MVNTILSSPFFTELVLPFILVFTLVFAVLQKSKVLGDGKKQIDAIVALVIGLIVVSFTKSVGIISALMPFLAVSLVVILVFMILLGAFFKAGAFDVHKGVKIAGGIIVAIAVAVAVLYNTGAWNYLLDLFSGGGSTFATNVIFVILIGAAIAVVIGFGGKDGK